MWSIIHRWKKEVIRWSSFMAVFIVAHLNCVQFERFVQINLKLTWRHGRSVTHHWIIQKFRRVSFWAACHIDVCPFTTTILFTYLLKVIPWYRLRFAGVASLINFPSNLSEGPGGHTNNGGSLEGRSLLSWGLELAVPVLNDHQEPQKPCIPYRNVW